MVKPTIVIGIGKAGCRMSSRLEEFATQENQREDFKFISIDTNENDLYDFSPDGADIFQLEKPKDTNFQEDKQSHSYLNDEYELATGQGAVRQRAVSRYHIDADENFEDLQEFLENNILRFVDDRVNQVDDPNVADLNIWLLHSLGGGTGSGAFPLISMLLNNTANSSAYDFFVGGMGSLPRIDGLEDNQLGTPDGSPEFYFNSYAALRELRQLINFEQNSNHYPLEINIEGYHRGVPTDEYPLKESPFDMYWLLGFDEDPNKGRSYRRHMNTVAATGIFYHASMSSIENFPDDSRYEENTLYALNAAQVEVPFDKMSTFVELSEDIYQAEQTVRELEQKIDEKKKHHQYLDELWGIEFDYRELPEPEYVDSETIRPIRNQVNNFEPSKVTERRIDLDERTDSLLRKAEQTIPDGPYDKSTIVTLIYCGQLLTYLDGIISEHRFKTRVEDVWNAHRQELRDEYPYSVDDSPLDKWNNAIEEYMVDSGNNLNNRIQNTLNPLRKRRLRKQKNELGDQLKILKRLYKQYDTLRNIRREARSRRDSARDQIEETKQSLETEINDLRRKKEKIKTEIRNDKSKEKTLRSDLSNTYSESGRVSLQVQNIDEITDQTISEVDSIADLVDRDFVSETLVAQWLDNRLTAWMSDPVQDLNQDRTVSTDPILGIMTYGRNTDNGDNTDLLDQNVPNKATLNDIINRKFNYYDEDEMLTEIEDGFRIWLLAFYTPLSFQNMSEYGPIHRRYEESDRDISEQFGDGVDDRSITTAFAYPELIDDERVDRLFGSDDSVGKAQTTD
jgi:hypothetical protein